jgi:hypothetical protein
MSISMPSAISAGVGSRPSSCSSAEERRVIRCRVPARFSGHPDDAALLRQGLKDGLTDPPHGIGDELDPLGLVELVRGPDQAEVPLVDQVGKRNALVLVLLGHRYDEAEVAAHQLVEGLLFAQADPLRQRHLLLLRDQRIPADLAEILIQRSFVRGRRTALGGRSDLQRLHRGKEPRSAEGPGFTP